MALKFGQVSDIRSSVKLLTKYMKEAVLMVFTVLKIVKYLSLSTYIMGYISYTDF